MKFLSTLQHKLGFTTNELKVILFLSLTFLLGTGIRWLKPSFVQSADASSPFNYAALDREFAERSKRIPELTGSQADTGSSHTLTKPHVSLPAVINLNTATKDALMRLPGIGEKYAERIIMYRDDNGPFDSIEQLDRVKGIGKKTIERIRPYLKL